MVGFQFFSSSPTLFANICIVCTWFHTLTNLSFFGISRGVFSLLHTSHCVGQRQQGLYTAKGSHKSLLQVFKSLGIVWESKLNLFRFLNLLYYRGRGILLIRNPFLAILSMFRSWKVFFSQFRSNETEMRGDLNCRHQKFGHHSQSEFSRKRHNSRPEENPKVNSTRLQLVTVRDWRRKGIALRELQSYTLQGPE